MTTLVDQINNNAIYNQQIIDYYWQHNPQPSAQSIKILALASDMLDKSIVLENNVVQKLYAWKLDKTPSLEPINFNTVEDRGYLLTKSRLAKLCTKIYFIAMIVVCSLGVALSMIGVATTLPILTAVGFSAVISGITLPAQGLIMNKFFNLILAKEHREARVNRSENFKAFVHKYLINKIRFTPKSEDLMDSKLHDIYCDWKKKAKAIFNQ